MLSDHLSIYSSPQICISPEWILTLLQKRRKLDKLQSAAIIKSFNRPAAPAKDAAPLSEGMIPVLTALPRLAFKGKNNGYSVCAPTSSQTASIMPQMSQVAAIVTSIPFGDKGHCNFACLLFMCESACFTKA